MTRVLITISAGCEMDRNYHVFQDGRLAREEGSLTVRTDDDIHRLPVENVGALYFHG